jgi:hypothetical protein
MKYSNNKDKFHKFDIGPFDICPSKSGIVYNYILTYIFIISNLFCGSILWIFEFCSYKTILYLLMNVRNIDMSLKETNNTSKINDDINVSNQGNNSRLNGTEIIIVENMNNIIGENKDINYEKSNSENQLINNINNNNIFKIINQKQQINKNDDKNNEKK